jgi:hypothetical protein
VERSLEAAHYITIQRSLSDFVPPLLSPSSFQVCTSWPGCGLMRLIIHHVPSKSTRTVTQLGV